MKYSEFNHDWSDMELQYLEGEIFVYRDGVMIGKVSKEYRYMMSTHYAGFEELPLPVAVKLFADMAMLAQTPLAEREEEKRYYLRLTANLSFYMDETYLNYNPIKAKYFVSNKFQKDSSTAIFTESEISQMDITGFEKVEVTE